jgi:hypothetical protein
VSCANTPFFVRVRTKYRTFSRPTHNKKIHQLIDRPPKPCPMASKSSDDGHKSHPTPSPMPSLVSVALSAIDFAVGLMKQPLRQHEDGAMVGSS